MKTARVWWVRCAACGWTTPSYWLSSCSHCGHELTEPQPELPDPDQLELPIPANNQRDHAA